MDYNKRRLYMRHTNKELVFLYEHLLKDEPKQFQEKFYLGTANVIAAAINAGMALAGSMALDFGHEHPTKLPGDIDLVVHDYKKIFRFFALLQMTYKNWQHRMVIQWNHNNDFVQPPAIDHIRIECPLFIPVCIFRLPEEPNVWWPSYHICCQAYDEVTQLAAEMKERRKKQEDTKNLPLMKRIDVAVSKLTAPELTQAYPKGEE